MNIKTLILILLIPTVTQAQVSIVNALPDIDTEDCQPCDKLSSKLAASVLWRDDNSKETKFNLTGAGSLSYKKRLWLAHFIAKGTYERENGEGTEAGAMEHLRFRLSLGELINPQQSLYKLSETKSLMHKEDAWYNDFYAEAFTQHEHDRYRALDARVLLGGGLAYVISSTKKLGIMVGTAYMAEYINFIGSTGSELNHRWSNYLQVNIVPSSRFSIEGVTFAQFKFNDFSDYLIMTSIALKIKATDWFGVRLGTGLDYDSNPPPNVKKFGSGVKSEIFVEF